MSSSDSKGFVLTSTRRSVTRSLLGLYRADALFRSSADFAFLGLAVYLFVAPLPLPHFDWFKSTPSGVAHAPGMGNAAPVAQPMQQGPTATQAQANAGDLALAADPNAGKRSAAKLTVRRDWFKLSDPAIMAALNRAADQIDATMPAAALAILNDIGRPDDPNVANLSAYAILQSRDTDSMQRAYAAHLRAAQAGHPESMHQVGQFLRLGAAGRVDLAEAVDWYEKGADAGSAAAATEAGRAYYLGWARPQDYTKAAAYYRRAAEGGDRAGMHNYGAALINGRGVARDVAAGRAWIEKAANAGWPEALYSMGKLTRKGIGGPRDVDAFIKWSQMAADAGSAAALYDLGMFFLSPDDSRPADVTRAAAYLKQAATKRFPPAQYAYATLCDRGAGVPQNNVQAFIYYSLALRGGETAAQARLDALRARMSSKDIETAQKLVSVAGSDVAPLN